MLPCVAPHSLIPKPAKAGAAVLKPKASETNFGSSKATSGISAPATSGTDQHKGAPTKYGVTATSGHTSAGLGGKAETEGKKKK